MEFLLQANFYYTNLKLERETILTRFLRTFTINQKSNFFVKMQNVKIAKDKQCEKCSRG